MSCCEKRAKSSACWRRSDTGKRSSYPTAHPSAKLWCGSTPARHEKVSCCPGQQDGQDGLTNLLGEGLHVRVILHNILAPKEFLGGYLRLSAFGELDNAFNAPGGLGAVKCNNCVVGITAVKFPCQRMLLSVEDGSVGVCHIPGSDVYELRKKNRVVSVDW